MNNQNNAYEYGRQAFLTGRPCIPAADTKFLNNVIKGRPAGSSTQLMKDWQKGWHYENLKTEA